MNPVYKLKINQDMLDNMMISPKNLKAFNMLFPNEESVKVYDVFERCSTLNLKDLGLWLATKLPHTASEPLFVIDKVENSLYYNNNVRVLKYVKLKGKNNIFVRGVLAIEGELSSMGDSKIIAESMSAYTINAYKKTKIQGRVNAGSINLYDNAVIKNNNDSIHANKDIKLYNNAQIDSDSVRGNNLYLNQNSSITGMYIIATNEIVLKDNACFLGKKGNVRVGAKIIRVNKGCTLHGETIQADAVYNDGGTIYGDVSAKIIENTNGGKMIDRRGNIRQ